METLLTAATEGSASTTYDRLRSQILSTIPASSTVETWARCQVFIAQPLPIGKTFCHSVPCNSHNPGLYPCKHPP